MTKKAKIFTFYFWKRELTDHNRIKWKVRQTGKEYIVDIIECDVKVVTYTRNTNPRAVMRGRGKIYILKFRENGVSKVMAIIK